MNKINLWLDDERDPAVWRPGETWVWVKTAAEAIALIDQLNVGKISLDHDLGEETPGNGYSVALHIESRANDGALERMEWTVHSANPVGSKRISMAMTNADRFWTFHEES